MRSGRFKNLSIVDSLLWLFRVGIIVLVIWGSYKGLTSGKYTAEVWRDFFIFGLAQGGIYALIALGYTLVYGILFMINFAHGEVFMSGAFTAYFVADAFDKSGFLNSNPIAALSIVMLVSMAMSITIAALLERIAYRPLRGAPRLVPLITAIGASYFLQYAFRGLYGSGKKVYPEPAILSGKWIILGAPVLKTQVVVFVTAVAMMFILYYFVQKTKTGKAMKQVDFIMGFIPGIKAFTAAVLGGIGNIPGAMVGGLVLGVIESVGPSLVLEGLGIPAAYQLKDVIAFTMLVLILIFRPQGILGQTLSEKKM